MNRQRREAIAELKERLEDIEDELAEIMSEEEEALEQLYLLLPVHAEEDNK